jgi:hypothetical protein
MKQSKLFVEVPSYKLSRPVGLRQETLYRVRGLPAGHCALRQLLHVTGLTEGSMCRTQGQEESCYFVNAQLDILSSALHVWSLGMWRGPQERRFWLCCYRQDSLKGFSKISSTQRTSACSGWNSCALKSTAKLLIAFMSLRKYNNRRMVL